MYLRRYIIFIVSDSTSESILVPIYLVCSFVKDVLIKIDYYSNGHGLIERIYFYSS